MKYTSDFSQCNIVVIGDAMLDRYWHGDTSRISPEAPVPVVKIEKEEERLGGAANVAVNVRVLGAKTTLLSEIGQDSVGVKLLKMLEESNVQAECVTSGYLKTTLKLRVLGRHQQLIRLDFEDKHPVPASLILQALDRIPDKIDIIILSDYAKGMLIHAKEIIQFARQKQIRVLVDPKSTDLSIYQGATILTPNLAEFEAAVGACDSLAVLEERALALVKKLNLQALLITRGSQGMTLIEQDKVPLHIPAQAREVYDITGAGDTVIAVLGACLVAGNSLAESAKLANIAAGLSVAKLGTAAITLDELQTFMAPQEERSKGVLPLNTLLSEVQILKRHGQKIVMTNGCFDILHAGHITYLQQARALGNCLIVAVNDDDSVRRLKGNSRPINTLANRMQLLAELKCVDYVVAFSQDTPESLILKILPQVLVKGGDYTFEQIVGADHVMLNGGTVKVLPFVQGLSTTNMVEKMKNSDRVLVGEIA